jgi:hypothetical protein
MALVCMKFLLVEICDMFSGIWRLGIVPSDFCETYMLLGDLVGCEHIKTNQLLERETRE